MPDPYAGERPLAYVALKDGRSATADELVAYCKSRLASFKAPARVEFRAELPKAADGEGAAPGYCATRRARSSQSPVSRPRHSRAKHTMVEVVRN